MSYYTPSAIPDSGALRGWLAAELRRVADAIASDLDFRELHEEPTRLYTGLTVLADGTDWDPGSGQGVYTYYASAWHKLG